MASCTEKLLLPMQGAVAALQAIVSRCGPNLLQKLPRLWEQMSTGLAHSTAEPSSADAPTDPTVWPAVASTGCNRNRFHVQCDAMLKCTSHEQALTESLHLLGVAGPCLHSALEPQLMTLLPGVVSQCAHASRAVQAAAALCARSLVNARPDAALPTLLRCALGCH